MLESLRQSLNLTTQWMLDETYLWYFWLRDTVVKITFVVSILALLFWTSTFLYGSFYYAYMPTAIHSRPVYLNFSPCERYTGDKECYFPYANLTFVTQPQTKQFLMRGQSYNIFLQMEVPQSPINENLGMFMINLELFANGGKIVEKSSRPALIKYRSQLLKYIEVLLFSPFFITGYKHEKESLTVELYDNFIDNVYHPIVGAHLMIQARRIEMYSSSLEVYARFTGLRYFMFFWPVSSAFFGIFGFFTLLCFITALSWYRCIGLISKHTQSLIQASGHAGNQSAYNARIQQVQRTLQQERGALARTGPPHVTVLDTNSSVEPPSGRQSGQRQTSGRSSLASSNEDLEPEGPLTASIRAGTSVQTLQASGESGAGNTASEDIPDRRSEEATGRQSSDSSGSNDSLVKVGDELLLEDYDESDQILIRNVQDLTLRRRKIDQ